MVRSSGSSWTWVNLRNPEDGGSVSIEVWEDVLWHKILKDHLSEPWEVVFGDQLTRSLRSMRNNFRVNTGSTQFAKALDGVSDALERQARKGLGLPCVLHYRGANAEIILACVCDKTWLIITRSGVLVIMRELQLTTAYFLHDVVNGVVQKEERCACTARWHWKKYESARSDPNQVFRIGGSGGHSWRDKCVFVTDKTWEKVIKEGSAAFDDDAG